MKKRLFACLLAVVLLLTAVLPLSSVAAEPAEEPITYPDIPLEKYDELLVKDGLVLAMDFFKTNEHWNIAVDDFPIGPAENDAYWYDANENGIEDEGEIYDFTKPFYKTEEAWRVTYHTKDGRKIGYYVPEDSVNFRPTYATKEEALAALAVAEEVEPLTGGWYYDVALEDEVVFDESTAAFAAAFREWDVGEREWLEQFVTYRTDIELVPEEGEATPIVHLSSYHPDVKPTAAAYKTNQPKVFSVFTPQAGYIQMRTNYHPSGGLCPSSITAKELVSPSLTQQWLLEPGSMTRECFIFFDVRPYYDINRSSFTALSNTTFTPYENSPFPSQTPSFANKKVHTFSLTLEGVGAEGSDRFMIRTPQKTVLDLTGKYNGSSPSSSNYLGWNSSAYNTKIYGYRYYNETLSDAAMRQNHLADLCKWFRLDISSFFHQGELNIAQGDLNEIATTMVAYSLTDKREDVVLAFEEALSSIMISGEGAAFDVFFRDYIAGYLDASPVRAFPVEYQNEVFTSYKAFVDANPTATPEARDAEVKRIVEAILVRDFGDYHDKAPTVDVDTFFAGAEMTTAASHFADVAKEYALDLAALSPVHPIIREYIYQSFADVKPGQLVHSAILGKRLADTTASYTVLYEGEVMALSLFRFEGYQLRLYGNSALRAVYSIDTEVLAAMEAKGYTVTVGTLMGVNTTKGMTLTKVNGTWQPTTDTAGGTPAKMQAAYKTGDDVADAFFPLDGKACFAYVLETQATLPLYYFSAYATIEKEGANPTFRYLAAECEALGSGFTMREAAEYCRDEMGVTAPAIQALCRDKMTSIYVDGHSLTDFVILEDAAAADAIEAFIDTVKEKTGVTMRTVADAAGVTAPLIRFAAGSAAALDLTDEGLCLTYTESPAADAAAFAAAVDAVTVPYQSGSVSIPVSLFAAHHVLTPVS